MNKLLLLCGALVFVCGARAANADDLSDIFASSAADGIVPVETVLSAARSEIDGTITEIELERKRGAWLYEVEVTSTDGRKWELLFEASSGRLLSRKRN